LCAEGIVGLMGMGKPSDAHQSQGGERRERAKQHLERLDGIKPHAREGEAGEAGEDRKRCERDGVRRYEGHNKLAGSFDLTERNEARAEEELAEVGKPRKVAVLPDIADIYDLRRAGRERKEGEDEGVHRGHRAVLRLPAREEVRRLSPVDVHRVLLEQDLLCKRSPLAADARTVD
jgi:hypothetical protein